MEQPAPLGWTGNVNQVLYCLGLAGADRDAGGQFLLIGAPVFLFMGVGPDCVVPPEAMYLVQGQPRSLAQLLGITSYGHNVTVIS